MQEIKTTLAELDALRGKATQGEWVGIEFHECHGCDSVEIHVDDSSTHNVLDSSDYIVALHNAYPAIRAYIEKLETEIADMQIAYKLANIEAEAGRNFAHDVGAMDARGVHENCLVCRECKSIFPVGMFNGTDIRCLNDGCTGVTMTPVDALREDWRELCAAALSAYHSATRDITSKEKEV